LSRSGEAREGCAASEQVELSVVIPAFNEGKRIANGLATLLASIERGQLGSGSIEIIVVDDGSSDDTADQASKLLAPYPNATVIRLGQNRGKGAATRTGVTAARGPILVFMDVDMAVHPSQIASLIEALEGNDIVVGSRSLVNSTTEADTFHRVVMGRIFTHIVRATVHLPLSDTQCGFKVFRTPVARLLFHFSTIDRFAFDVDILARAYRLGFRVTEVPVHWVQIPGSRIRPLADPISMLADVLKIRRRTPTTIHVPGVILQSTSGVAVSDTVITDLVGGGAPTVNRHDGAVVALFPLCDLIEVARAQKSMPLDAARVTATATEISEAELISMVPIHFAVRSATPEERAV
jgi:hypothetical protein